jgi:hypothetical protein
MSERRRAGGCVRMCACPSVRVCVCVCIRMCTYACAHVRARAWVDSSHPIIYQPPTERVCARMCAYTRDLAGA